MAILYLIYEERPYLSYVGFCVFFKPVKMTTLIHSYTQNILGLDGWRWPEASILTGHGAWLGDEWAQVSQHRVWGATDMGIRTHTPLIFQWSELRQPQKGEISLGSSSNAECRPPGSCSDYLPRGMCGSILQKGQW